MKANTVSGISLAVGQETGVALYGSSWGRLWTRYYNHYLYIHISGGDVLPGGAEGRTSFGALSVDEDTAFHVYLPESTDLETVAHECAHIGQYAAREWRDHAVLTDYADLPSWERWTIDQAADEVAAYVTGKLFALLYDHPALTFRFRE